MYMMILYCLPGGDQDHRQDTAWCRQPQENLSWNTNHEVTLSPAHCSPLSGVCQVSVTLLPVLYLYCLSHGCTSVFLTFHHHHHHHHQYGFHCLISILRIFVVSVKPWIWSDVDCGRIRSSWDAGKISKCRRDLIQSVVNQCVSF